MGADARTSSFGDPADTVARVSVAKRDVLLRVYRRRLRYEDLEDCYSQATLELLARARRGAVFDSPQHVSNALEQKFASRINDRHRALGGRSAAEAAFASAVSLDDQDSGTSELRDRGAGVAERVLLRHELRRLSEVAEELTPDQRLVLVCQVSLDMDSAEFCRRYGWSGEKFRKVAQRARAKLRTLTSDYDSGQRCRRLEPDLLAYAAQVAGQREAGRVARHLENCPGCAGRVRDLERSGRQVAALLPLPVLTHGSFLIKAWVAATALRHHLPWVGRPPALTGRSSGAMAGGAAAGGTAVTGGGGAFLGAGGSVLGLGAGKLGLTALCIAGAAGSYAVCQRAGWVPWDAGRTQQSGHRHTAGHRRHAHRARAMRRAPGERRTATWASPHPGGARRAGRGVMQAGAGGVRPGRGRGSSAQREFGFEATAGASPRRARAARRRRRARRRALAARAGAGAGARPGARSVGSRAASPGARSGRSRAASGREFGFER